MLPPKLDDILSDRTHGSTYIAKQVLLYVISNYNASSIRDKLTLVVEQFPDMQILRNIVNNLSSSENIKDEAHKLLEQLESVVLVKEAFISSSFFSEQKRIMTFSNSQTVKQILAMINHPNVTCMESKPGEEGRELATSIGGKLVSDEQGYELVRNRNVDLILFGCDAYSDKYIINKTGSYELMKLGRSYGIDSIVLTLSIKYSQDKLEEPVNSMFERFQRHEWIHVLTEENSDAL